MSMSIEKQASSSSPNPSQSCWQLPTMDSQQYPYYNYYVREREREREQMFEKPLTPSDVGKLNRLVIPKQYAERYFPIDSESGEKGLLLSFEDEEGGKTWKFRYSYWTSSQSYVLTKGWSRFVKDKRLDAGDVVLFQRCRPGTNDDRLFIACRRRSSLSNETLTATAIATATATATTEEDNAPCFYMNTVGSGEGGSGEAMPARRRLRLFGVNLECGPEPPQQLVSSGSWSSQFTNNA